jgi:N-acetylmuramoyl-L-alanine amidase
MATGLRMANCAHPSVGDNGLKRRRAEGNMRGIKSLLIATASAFLLCSVQGAFGADPPTPVAVGARLAQDAARAELAFDLSGPVDPTVSALGSPNRVIVDLPEVNFQVDPSQGRNVPTGGAAIVKTFRFGLLSPGKSRIVIDLARPACPERVESKPIVDGTQATRLKIELKPCSDAAFAALPKPLDTPVTSPETLKSPTLPVVVVDPGHGGVDGGAHGVQGAVEKTLVYEFCVELKRQLQSAGRYNVVMTREGDQYVDLEGRVAIAREANASLFVSIHADTLSEAAGVSGSTVYTVADRASDAEAARIAAHENAADRNPRRETAIADDPQVTDILFDLKRRETRTYSHMFSRNLVDNMREVAQLNHNPERSAGFVVLKAPEFPSVLVELGYLSNAQDVQSLSSPQWRTKMAAAMVKAIDSFFVASDGPENPSGAGVALRAPQDAASPR